VHSPLDLRVNTQRRYQRIRPRVVDLCQRKAIFNFVAEQFWAGWDEVGKGGKDKNKDG
jgi:hypothetical protein